MQKFNISIHSFRQVETFVKLAAQQSFEVFAGNEHQNINGKDLMGMFSLDFSRPVQISVNCSENEFLRFRNEAVQLLVS